MLPRSQSVPCFNEQPFCRRAKDTLSAGSPCPHWWTPNRVPLGQVHLGIQSRSLLQNCAPWWTNGPAEKSACDKPKKE